MEDFEAIHNSWVGGYREEGLNPGLKQLSKRKRGWCNDRTPGPIPHQRRPGPKKWTVWRERMEKKGKKEKVKKGGEEKERQKPFFVLSGADGIALQ